MKKDIKIAVLGAGKWGTNLIRNVAYNSTSEFAGVCDLDTEALTRVSLQYPHVPLFEDYEGLLKAQPDAVIIATPAAMHYEHAMQALQAGCSVLVEKPLATKVEQARKLIDMAEQKSLTLMTGHTFLYNNIVHEAKARIDSGELGEIYYIYSQRLNLGNIRQDVNVLWNLAPHDISIINHLFSGLPHRVSSHGMCFVQKEKNVADVSFCRLDYPDGRSAHLHLSWIDPQKVRQMVIVGSKKMLVYDDVNTEKHIQIYDKSVEKEFSSEVTNFADYSMRLRAGNLIIPNVRLTEPLSVEIAHLVECIEKGAKPISDGRNGLEVVCVLAALSESLTKSGAVTEVKYP